MPMNQLVLHETGHFYFAIQFSVLPEFVTIVEKNGVNTGIVYATKSSSLLENERMSLFYTIAGGMIAEAHIFNRLEYNRCKDDIEQLIKYFGVFDKNEIFRIAAELDHDDLMRAYSFILKSLEDKEMVTGAEIILESGMRSSLRMKLIAWKRLFFGKGFSNKEKSEALLKDIRSQEVFNVSDFRE